MTVFDRVSIPPLPHDESAERAILGALLLRPTEVEAAFGELLPEDFYFDQHGKLFAALLRAHQDGEAAGDPVTIRRYMGDGAFDAMGGYAFLAAVEDEFNFRHYVADAFAAWARAVRDLARRRKLIMVCYQTGAELADRLVDVPDALVRLDATVAEVAAAEPGTAKTWASVEDLIVRADLFSPRPAHERLETGLPRIDAYAGALLLGKLTLLAARPTVGKTTFLLQVAAHNAIDRGIPCGVLSLEMPAADLLDRLVAQRARVNYGVIWQRKISETLRPRVEQALGTIRSAPLYFDDRTNLGVNDVASAVRALHRKHGDLRLICLDYLGLMRLPSDDTARHDLRLTATSTALCNLARELGIAILLVVQLNRRPEVEKRPPILSDLADSDGIARDASSVLFLHRERLENSALGDAGQVGVLKARYGQEIRVPISFDGRIQTFVEVDDAH